MAATANQHLDRVGADVIGAPVAASTTIYRNTSVGDNGSGYARPLVAGDPFMGISHEKVDNSAGSAGDLEVQMYGNGQCLVLPISGVALTDRGKDVFASADDTYTLTQSSNTRIGFVRRYHSSGKAEVQLEVCSGIAAELTDNSGGTASDTIAAITDTATKNAVASLTAKVNQLLRRLGQ